MKNELLRENEDSTIRPWKEILMQINLQKLMSPEGFNIAPELIVDEKGRLMDVTYADYFAIANMCIWGIVAEYPDFQSLGTPDYVRSILRSGYNRRDYEPSSRIIDAQADCDNDTILIKTGRAEPGIRLLSYDFESKLKRLEFGLKSPGIENGLITSVIVNEDWIPLMVGFKNQEALAKTLQTNLVTFQTRSRGGKLWTKGEESGYSIAVKELRVVGRNTLVVIGSPKGPVCHTGARTCFDNPPVVGT